MATFLNLGHGMRDVGQPIRPPWYPALRIPANVLWTHVVGRLPGGRHLLDRRAARALRRMEAFQYAGRRPPIAPIEAASADSITGGRAASSAEERPVVGEDGETERDETW